MATTVGMRDPVRMAGQDESCASNVHLSLICQGCGITCRSRAQLLVLVMVHRGSCMAMSRQLSF